jgi:hypothetical protein
MRKFLLSIFNFILFTFLICILLIAAPTTPKSSKSILFSSKNKIDLLKKTNKNRLIFIGGSNISYGLNSQMICDSLKLNPINTGLPASIGLRFMISNYLRYSKPNDIIILIPEYHQFFGDFAYGGEGEELMRMIFDVDISNITLLNHKQFFFTTIQLPKLISSKLDLAEYFGYKYDFVYSKYIYNKYGDVDIKYLNKNNKIAPTASFNNKLINKNIIRDILYFKNTLKMRGCELYLSFPGYQKKSFILSKTKINQIYCLLKKNNLKTIGTPEVFQMEDTLLFDSPYHLNSKGVNIRTKILIEKMKLELDIVRM